MGVFPTILYKAFGTRIGVWAPFVVKWWSTKAKSPSSTLGRTSRWIPTVIPEDNQFWLEEHRKRVRTYDTTQPWGSTIWHVSKKSRKERVRSKVGKDRVCSSFYEKMIQDEMLSTLGSAEYILHEATSISVTPGSPSAPITQFISVIPV